MKKQLFSILALSLTIGSLNAVPFLTGVALGAGVRTGNNTGNEIKKNIANKDYTTAAGLVAGSVALRSTGALLESFTQPIASSISAEMPLDPTVESLARKYVNTANALRKATHIGSRFMIFTSIALLGHEYLRPAIEQAADKFCDSAKQSFDTNKKLAVIATEQAWTNIGKRFNPIKTLTQSATIDRSTLLGNK